MKGVKVLDDEILEQYDDADWDMSVDREVEEAILQNGGHWTIEDVCFYLYGIFANYDEPQKATVLTVMSPAPGIEAVTGGSDGSMSIG